MPASTAPPEGFYLILSHISCIPLRPWPSTNSCLYMLHFVSNNIIIGPTVQMLNSLDAQDIQVSSSMAPACGVPGFVHAHQALCTNGQNLEQICKSSTFDCCQGLGQYPINSESEERTMKARMSFWEKRKASFRWASVYTTCRIVTCLTQVKISGQMGLFQFGRNVWEIERYQECKDDSHSISRDSAHDTLNYRWLILGSTCRVSIDFCWVALVFFPLLILS